VTFETHGHLRAHRRRPTRTALADRARRLAGRPRRSPGEAIGHQETRVERVTRCRTPRPCSGTTDPPRRRTRIATATAARSPRTSSSRRGAANTQRRSSPPPPPSADRTPAGRSVLRETAPRRPHTGTPSASQPALRHQIAAILLEQAVGRRGRPRRLDDGHLAGPLQIADKRPYCSDLTVTHRRWPAARRPHRKRSTA